MGLFDFFETEEKVMRTNLSRYALFVICHLNLYPLVYAFLFFWDHLEEPVHNETIFISI